MNRKKITILDLADKKRQGIPITMLTAYDYTGGLLVDAAEIDIILIGDSLGMVMMGLPTTVPVTMDEMLHHCRAVARGTTYAHLVGDMPFMSYQADTSEAIRNAGRFLKEGNVDSIKLEGGRDVVDKVRGIVGAGIPVMGHIGLTPQSVSKLGGFRVQGKTAADARRLLDDALALEDVGCYAIVLESVPAPVAADITARLHIPTIGIGAGASCDGQVLVFHDVVGLFEQLKPRFAKQYAAVGAQMREAFAAFRDEVLSGQFPAEEHTFSISGAELAEFRAGLEP